MDVLIGREDAFPQFPSHLDLDLLGPMADEEYAGLDDFDLMRLLDF